MFNKDVFCPVPWIEFATLPDGSVRLCCKALDNCITDENNKPYNLAQHTIEQIWNSKKMRSIRMMMLSGEQPKECSVCYNEDKVGKRSHRIKELEIWENDSDLINAVNDTNDGKIKAPPIYLDLRFGNLCNLKCRTCEPLCSSQIQKENNELSYTFPHLKESLNRANNLTKWYENPSFTQQLEKLIPNLRLVYLTGGEPTLVKENHKFLQKCIEMGFATNINLRFVINLTNITNEFLDLISSFRQVDIHCSIDGLGKHNDYLRYPSKWQKIVTNLNRIRDLPNTTIYLIHTLSLLNIYQLPNFLRWFETLNLDKLSKIKFNINPINKPKILHPSILTDTHKEKVKERLLSIDTTPKLKKEIKSILNLMYIPIDNEELKQLRKEFIQFIQIVDNHRKQSLVTVFPELEEFYLFCQEIDDEKRNV